MLCAILLYAILVTTPQKRNNGVEESPNKVIYDGQREGGTSLQRQIQTKQTKALQDEKGYNCCPWG